MIQVVYNRRSHRITAKGHAHSAEKGADLVCAAASVLLYTLAANALSLKEKGYTRHVTAKLNEGDSEIVCIPKCRYESVTDMILSSVCVGFELLAKQYSANVSYEIKE